MRPPTQHKDLSLVPDPGFLTVTWCVAESRGIGRYGRREKIIGAGSMSLIIDFREQSLKSSWRRKPVPGD